MLAEGLGSIRRFNFQASLSDPPGDQALYQLALLSLRLTILNFHCFRLSAHFSLGRSPVGGRRNTSFRLVAQMGRGLQWEESVLLGQAYRACVSSSEFT